MRVLYIFLFSVLVVAFPEISNSCRRFDGPAQRLAAGYQTGSIVTVALVKVSRAKYTQRPISDAHPWKADAAVTKILSGKYSAKTVTFERGRGSAACDDGEPAPKSGAIWAVYFWRKLDGTLDVWQSYPAYVANSADPKLKGRFK